MPTSVDTEPLRKGHLGGWQKSTADLLMHIVNNCGIQYRCIDSGHIALYPPDGGRPFKVSARRSVQENSRILRRQFMAPHDIPTPEKWKAEQRAARVAAAQEEQAEVETQVFAATDETEQESSVTEQRQDDGAVPEDVLHALSVVASYLGTPTESDTVDALEEEVSDLNHQVAALTEQVGALTVERDEALSKLALLKETFDGLVS